MGGYRDLGDWFGSGHERLVRVVQITKIPGHDVYLGSLAKPVELSDHINVICIPTVKWYPRNRKCVITGRRDGTLNDAFELIVKGECRSRPGSSSR